MTKEMVVRWVVATPEWVLNMDCDGPNCEIVPAKAYDRLSEENRKLRKIIADVMFREMNGIKPVLRTGDVAWAEIEPRSGEPPADLGGCSIACSACGKEAVLRYTDSSKERVSIESVTGWTYDSTDGVRCPSCNAENRLVEGYCCCPKSGTSHERTPQCDI